MKFSGIEGAVEAHHGLFREPFTPAVKWQAVKPNVDYSRFEHLVKDAEVKMKKTQQTAMKHHQSA